MADPFITPEDLTAKLGRDVTTDDAAVMACDYACDTIRSITELTFNAGTATVALDGTDTDALLMPERPVNAISAVSVNGRPITDFTLTDNGLLLRGTAGGGPRPFWPRGRQNVVVAYEYGYQDVPRDVRGVALAIAERFLVQGAANSETVGDVTIDYGMQATDLTANEQRILYGYRQQRSF